MWSADKRVIIQIGDAEPHAEPRGTITKEMVFNEANAKGVAIYPIFIETE